MTTTQLFHDPIPPFQMLLGQPCWAVAAGAGTGDQVSLHFGRKFPRLRSLDNPKIREQLRTHQGEVILFIQCGWRVKRNGKVLFDSDHEADGYEGMTRALEQVSGASVSEMDIKLPPMALALKFDNGTLLELRSDLPSLDDPHDNFSLAFGDSTFVIGPDLGLRVESRKGVGSMLGYAVATPEQRTIKARAVMPKTD